MKKPTDKNAVAAVVEQKAFRGRTWEKNHMYVECGNTFAEKEIE